MGLTKQSATFTEPQAGVIQVAIANETRTFTLTFVQDLMNGLRPTDLLVYQAFLVLFQAGVDPRAATLGQIQTALEAGSYFWGN